jgi:hypothetical protein
MIRYVLKQQTKDGLWTSPEVFTAPDHPTIWRAIRAGFIQGEQRWAESESGVFLGGIEANGKEYR